MVVDPALEYLDAERQHRGFGEVQSVRDVKCRWGGECVSAVAQQAELFTRVDALAFRYSDGPALHVGEDRDDAVEGDDDAVTGKHSEVPPSAPPPKSKAARADIE